MNFYFSCHFLGPSVAMKSSSDLFSCHAVSPVLQLVAFKNTHLLLLYISANYCIFLQVLNVKHMWSILWDVASLLGCHLLTDKNWALLHGMKRQLASMSFCLCSDIFNLEQQWVSQLCMSLRQRFPSQNCVLLRMNNCMHENLSSS